MCPSATISSTLIKLMEQLSGNLDLVVADVDQSLDGIDLSVAVLDCCAWGASRSVYCALRHGRHLGSSVDDGINVVLLSYGGLHWVLFLAYAFGKGSCPLCAQFRFECWCRAAVSFSSIVLLMSGAAYSER